MDNNILDKIKSSESNVKKIEMKKWDTWISVRELTGMQYLDIISKVKDGNTFYNLAIIESVYDADNQERLFSLNNMDVVSNLGIPEYTVLIEAINKLNGWDSVGASNQKNLKKVK